MRAVVHHRYGSPAVLEVREISQPVLTDDGVLVHVHAAALNPLDWYGLSGRPWIARPMGGMRRPRDHGIGVDFAGTVEAVGEGVTGLAPGDDVFGLANGALAEYVCARKAVVPKPTTLTFEEAAAVPAAGFTALQALRDHGRVEQGQRVLVNGASGGVGTFAVQIAKALGAEVTGVCSTRNVDLVRSLGADHVVDYTQDDFTRSDRRYDLLLDVAGSRSFGDCRRVLAPGAKVVVIGGSKDSRLLGPLRHIVAMKLAGVRSGHQVIFFIAKPSSADLGVLAELIESGKVRPVIDGSHSLDEVSDAFRRLADGHARGKIVVTL
jgi:NADPH:quinone reductase-like Zn-dependent oxidoreductase